MSPFFCLCGQIMQLGRLMTIMGEARDRDIEINNTSGRDRESKERTHRRRGSTFGGVGGGSSGVRYDWGRVGLKRRDKREMMNWFGIFLFKSELGFGPDLNLIQF